jgi:hypothetical protein
VKICAEEEKPCSLHPQIESRGPKALDRTTAPVRNCKLTVNLIALPCAIASFSQFTPGLE